MPRSTAFRCTAETKSPCSSTTAAGTALSLPRNTGSRASPVRSRSSMARIRRCSSPALNTCRRDNRNTNSPVPSKVHPGPLTGLPIPAHAEIVFEGHLLPMSETTLPEGPFGEFTGYYASQARPAPVMDVSAVHHRADPILLGSPPMKPPRFHFGLPCCAATIWQNLDAAGVTDVVGAWQHVSQLMTVVALKQRYDGHAKRAALVAAAHSYMAR